MSRNTRSGIPLGEDPERRETFLRYLANGKPVAEAARLASPHLDVAKDGRAGLSTFRHHRDRDPRFADAWDQAVEEGKAKRLAELESLAFDRIKNPPKRPVLNRDGEIVGEVADINAATKIHLRALAMLDHRWADKSRVSHEGRVEHAHAHIHAETRRNSVVIDMDDLRLLDEEDQDRLIGLVTLMGSRKRSEKAKQELPPGGEP